MPIEITAIIVVCTACLLSCTLCKLFSHPVIPYVPSVIYAFGGAYFLALGGAMRGELQSQLKIGAIVMLIAAFASFGVCAWLHSKRPSS